ncbi:hypothetical protein LPB86_01450 [Pedobacter sp. MC2016-14]|uniref:hypothetical protein n=1 Tax=Pedobacter sp. MC2016-14 TaxID=2897327 RepID=UPI001E3A9386|nr:hypothetical protein [Pedobacter sp. MC2016-14]MCD0486874.1 hypothetical protein [Pedobacter sp. MC2016-14]
MAIRKGKEYTGAIGDVIWRKYRKRMIAQSKAKRVKQTIETKKSATRFGIASTIAGRMRQGFRPSYSHKDGTMVNRFTTTVRSILDSCFDKPANTHTFYPDSFNRLIGFAFNEKSKLTDSFFVNIKLSIEDDALRIRIPDIAIPVQFNFPARANYCVPRISVFWFSPATGRELSRHRELNAVSNEKSILPAQEIIFEAPKGTVCVVALGLNYYYLRNDIKTPINSEKFAPSGICGAIVNPGEFPEKDMGKELYKWASHAGLKVPGTIFSDTSTPILEEDPGITAEEAMLATEMAQKKELDAAKNEKAVEVARNLKMLGLADIDIANATGLAVEEIERL